MIEKIRLLPSKRRIWLGFIASIFLIGLACVAVHNGHRFGWFLIILFSLGVLAPGLLLLPGASWLELDEVGFTLCLSFRPGRYLWRHVTEIAVANGVVALRFLPERSRSMRGVRFARAVSGYDGSIPDMFRLRPQSLADLMMKYKQNQTSDATSEPVPDTASSSHQG